ncbi:hypothetical protein MOV08_39655 [Streptomyces yunnanensis]|uniref:Platelet-activating factor acetylhydrolase n=1 Tax=Streptomyces yunnanensis TaxID=156453 RepID=A0ABY8AID4_9ACTN|nr:hypothetical protein [Streptomyces yunnanensis]WEB44800.1 hypothetical protein MOV08_39655 [Streptomyces yunnanensis]
MADTKCIGMAGHSIGGDSTAHTVALDGRVRAGVNMDRMFNVPVPVSGLQGRSFMLLGSAAEVNDPSAPLSGRRAAQIRRSHVGAFFDRHLRDIREPLRPVR